jgi:hypothetical protein
VEPTIAQMSGDKGKNSAKDHEVLPRTILRGRSKKQCFLTSSM